VIKPAAQTPLSMLALMDILTEAAPAGVVNCVTATDAGGVMEPLIRSGLARKLSFTGSTAVGQLLLEQCAEKILRTSLELGGNAPFIVFEDADLDEAVRAIGQDAQHGRGLHRRQPDLCAFRGQMTSSVAAWLRGWSLARRARHRRRRQGWPAD
jgi:acyl-CoA reductase-like NAD-dependent aldehyde dehydrogenase